MRPRRRRRLPGKSIMISATDDEWEMVRARARNRGLSIARYLTGLARAHEGEGHLLALAGGEQREMLEAVREIRASLGRHPEPLIAEIRERGAALFEARTRDLIARGRGDDLREVLAALMGDERAAAVMDEISAAAARHPTRRKRQPDPKLPDLFA